jgi:hypothetical protein
MKGRGGWGGSVYQRARVEQATGTGARAVRFCMGEGAATARLR